MTSFSSDDLVVEGVTMSAVSFMFIAGAVTVVLVEVCVILYLFFLRRPSFLEVSKTRQRTTALHEAGHAVVQALLFGSASVFELCTKTAVRGPGDRYGHMKARLLKDEEIRPWTMSAVRDQLTVLLGGRAADEVLSGGPHAGASSDLEHATDLLVTALTQWGIGEMLVVYDNPLLDPPQDLDSKIHDELRRALRHAKGIVTTNRSIVETLAEFLMKSQPSRHARTLSQAEIEGFFLANPPSDPGEP